MLETHLLGVDGTFSYWEIEEWILQENCDFLLGGFEFPFDIYGTI